jgi:hypothetical protein
MIEFLTTIEPKKDSWFRGFKMETSNTYSSAGYGTGFDGISSETIQSIASADTFATSVADYEGQRSPRMSNPTTLKQLLSERSLLPDVAITDVLSMTTDRPSDQVVCFECHHDVV